MKRVLENLDRGLEFGVGGKERYFVIRVSGKPTIRHMNYLTSKVTDTVYGNYKELIAAMRMIQPDLRRWELCEV